MEPFPDYEQALATVSRSTVSKILCQGKWVTSTGFRERRGLNPSSATCWLWDMVQII